MVDTADLNQEGLIQSKNFNLAPIDQSAASSHLCNQSRTEMEPKVPVFFHTKLPQNKAVRVAKIIKIHYDFVMHDN